MTKLLEVPPRPIGRGTLLRLIKRAPAQNIFQKVIEQRQHDYLWPTGSMWLGIFSSALFSQKVSRDFWIGFVEEATVLNCESLRSDKTNQMLGKEYEGTPLTARFGCPAVRSLFKSALAESRDGELDLGHPDPGRVLVADQLAVLMRILAWQVADIVVDIWDLVVQDGMEDILPLDSILPCYDLQSCEWSNPMDCALKNLAKIAGWQEKQLATTFLGNLWSRVNAAENVESASRHRLLRNWIQGKKGRPRFETLLNLATAVTSEQAIRAGMSPEGRKEDAWIQAAILRVGETLFVLLHDLIKQGFTPGQITGIMDTYRFEYRFARQKLGKPMSSEELS